MAVVADASSPANGTAAVFTLLTQLCTAGWIVKRWSDATTLSADDVNLTTNPYGSSASGAGNLGNTSAWFRVAAPDASREWLFQRGSSDATWTISRSIAGFTGGTPNATTAGTATDATALFSAATAFSATPGRWFVSCDNAAAYGWAAYAITLGGGNVLTILIDEPLISGTEAVEDTDPYLWIGYYNITGLGVSAFSVATNATAIQAYKRFPVGSNQRASFGQIYDTTGYFVAPSASTAAQIGPTPSGGLEVPLQIPVFRSGTTATTTGWIGYTSRLRWGTVYAGRANGQTLQSDTTYWIFAAGCWISWDSSTPALS